MTFDDLGYSLIMEDDLSLYIFVLMFSILGFIPKLYAVLVYCEYLLNYFF